MDANRLLEKLKRLLPPPAPSRGWGFVRLMGASWILGPEADTRQAEVEANLSLGAQNNRIDAAPTDWTTDPHTWIFQPALTDSAGAAGFYLDTWGRSLGVPREPGEDDGRYAPRILAEILRPNTTNAGLAKAIDQGLGTSGTKVREALDVLKVNRLNSPGKRMNSPTRGRLNSAGQLAGDLSCCFIVQVPLADNQPYNEATVQRLVSRWKAAGTRLIGVYRLPVGDGGFGVGPFGSFSWGN